jgi:hypothetical protein
MQNITIYKNNEVNTIYINAFGYQLTSNTIVILRDENVIAIHPLDSTNRVDIENIKEEPSLPENLPDNVVSLN